MKFKGQIEFNNNRYFLDVNSSEKIKEKRAVLQDGIVPIIQFTENDEFMGKRSEVIHIDSVTLNLASRYGYNFQNNLSKGARIHMDFKKLTAVTDFRCQIDGNSVLLNGSLKFVVNVKDVISKDLQQSDSLIFSNIDIRTGPEILSFSKYGEDWELERKERNLYADSDDKSYISGRPKIISA